MRTCSCLQIPDSMGSWPRCQQEPPVNSATSRGTADTTAAAKQALSARRQEVQMCPDFWKVQAFQVPLPSHLSVVYCLLLRCIVVASVPSRRLQYLCCLSVPMCSLPGSPTWARAFRCAMNAGRWVLLSAGVPDDTLENQFGNVHQTRTLS
jgi:hypothetical protein